MAPFSAAACLWMTVFPTVCRAGGGAEKAAPPSPPVVCPQHLATPLLNPAEPWRVRADETVDFNDSAAVFAFLFHRLPDEVRVLPTENYYYWQLHRDGRELHGNLRLASGQREKGFLSFAAEERRETPGGETIRWARQFGPANGVKITCPDALSSVVEAQGKRVRFQFNAIPQLPPPPGALTADEAFVARTFDESGLPFYLCFHHPSRRFFWILNEENQVPEQFLSIAPDVFSGDRTGFIFWTDRSRSGRKILAGVSRMSVRRNDSFDGPFDQLADNYAAQVPLRKYAEIAFPERKGMIDQFGYLTNQGKPARLAITGYVIYGDMKEVISVCETAASSPHPLAVITTAGKGL